MVVVRVKEMVRKGRTWNDIFFYRLRLTLGHCPSIGIEADSDNRLEHCSRQWWLSHPRHLSTRYVGLIGINIIIQNWVHLLCQHLPLLHLHATKCAGRLCTSAPICNVGATIADIWAVENRGVPIAQVVGLHRFLSFLCWFCCNSMGPCIGPMIGGWSGMHASWQWIYWVLFIFDGTCFIFTLFIPKTLAPVLLCKKAERLQKETGDDKYQTLEELENSLSLRHSKLLWFSRLSWSWWSPSWSSCLSVSITSFSLWQLYSSPRPLFRVQPALPPFLHLWQDSSLQRQHHWDHLRQHHAVHPWCFGSSSYSRKLYKKATRNAEACLFPMMAGSLYVDSSPPGT